MPTLVVVSGPPRTGKTTLAHAIARAVPCPAICRDEIKEGMVHAHGGLFQAERGDPLTQRTLPLFFDVLRMLLAERVTVVAEAAFQNLRWRQGLEPLTDLARLRVVQCHTKPAVAKDRRRLGESAHAAFLGEEIEDWEQAVASFDRLSVPRRRSPWTRRKDLCRTSKTSSSSSIEGEPERRDEHRPRGPVGSPMLLRRCSFGGWALQAPVALKTKRPCLQGLCSSGAAGLEPATPGFGDRCSAS